MKIVDREGSDETTIKNESGYVYFYDRIRVCVFCVFVSDVTVNIKTLFNF